MGSNYLLSPLTLIINTIFELYILLVLLRFMLQTLRADFYNPVSQFIVRLTTPPLRHLRRFIPSIQGQDTAALLLCLALIYLKFILLRLLDVGVVQIGNVIAAIGSISYAGLLIISIADLLALVFTVFLIAIFIQVILSWVSPGTHNPVIGLVTTLSRPIMRPIQKFLPPFGGMDLSPLFAGLAIMVIKMLVIPPLVALGSF
ncbi:MAG: YggT family protein [Gammaproteobacteria bacterium]|jgi:YggT family protein